MSGAAGAVPATPAGLRDGAAGLIEAAGQPWPRITIVTPSFNQAPYLEQCMRSVLDQRYPNLEYIVMDGGSTDGSVDIIKRYADRLSYWQSRADGGQYAAIEAGFARATGEIMGWLNSDDVLHPGALWIVAKVFRAWPDVRWLTGRPTIVDAAGNLDFVLGELVPWTAERHLSVGGRHIQQESTFWRRSLYLEAGGRLQTDLALAGDYELWARFFRRAQLHTVDALIGGFRRHEAQKTASPQAYNDEARIIAERERHYLRLVPGPGEPPPPAPITSARLVSEAGDRLSAESFASFAYSRTSHFAYFDRYSRRFLGRPAPDPRDDLKVYQDLLAYTFLLDVIPAGSRILEIGGGDSRVLRAVAGRYECWNIDKFEDAGSGPAEVQTAGYRIVRDYIGNGSAELPDGYFDFVFSISALEHVEEDEEAFHRICRDIDRVLKDGGLSLHCFDVRVADRQNWCNTLAPFMAAYFGAITPPVRLARLRRDPDAFFMTEEAYRLRWQPITKRSYQEYGRPASCNVLWRKGEPVGDAEHGRSCLALNRRGEDALRQGRTGEAERLFMAALQANRTCAPAYRNMAALRLSQGDRVDALTAYRNALISNPADRTALKGCLSLVGRESVYEVLGDHLWAYLDARPGDAEVRREFIQAHESFLQQLLSRSTVDEAGGPPADCLVSAIVSTYNAEAFIAECLSDLEAQSIRDRLEVIVIDAASPQQERAIVREYQRRYGNIRYVRTPGRIGIYQAWNLGALMARGSLITPASTNDRVSPNAYEVMSAHLADHSGVSLVYGDSDLTTRPHQPFGSTPEGRYQWADFSYDDLLFNFLVGPHPMWRRSIHREVGYFDERYVAIADQDFWLRLGRDHRIDHIGIVTGLAWITPGALSASPQAVIEGFAIQRKHQKSWLSDRGIFHTPAQLEMVTKRYLEVLCRLLELGQAGAAEAFHREYAGTLAPDNARKVGEMLAKLKRPAPDKPGC